MSNRIREIREDRAKAVPAAFTIAAVARRIGVAVETMWRWEHGITKPSPRHAKALAKQLNVTVEELGLDEAVPAEDGNGDAEE